MRVKILPIFFVMCVLQGEWECDPTAELECDSPSWSSTNCQIRNSQDSLTHSVFISLLRKIVYSKMSF